MRDLFIKYKLVFQFIIGFIITYSVLTIGYKLYLEWSEGSNYYPDYATNLVGQQSRQILEALGYSTELEPHPDEPSLKVIMKGTYIARIIEGCNAISIIILFISFVIAFKDGLKKTALFILGGSVLIYAANLFRIALLCIGLYHYPSQRDLLHSVVFPAIIYGMVFLLWMVWVNHFNKNPKDLEKSH